jgi:hypothetical protein
MKELIFQIIAGLVIGLLFLFIVFTFININDNLINEITICESENIRLNVDLTNCRIDTLNELMKRDAMERIYVEDRK